MAEGPSTALTALLTIIVIFVIVLILYKLPSETFSQITGIADEVFQTEEAKKGEAQSLLVESYQRFVSDIDTCAGYGKDACFCFTKSFGDLPENALVHIDNIVQGTEGEESLVSVIDSNGAYLVQESKPYRVGLIYVEENELSAELKCVVPSKLEFTGMEIEGSNRWYALWVDPVAKKGVLEQGKDYLFGFYQEMIEGESSDPHLPYLKSAPILYRINDDTYCLLTDLVRYKIESGAIGSGSMYSLQPIAVETVSVLGFEYKTVLNVEELYDFFTGEDVSYCHDTTGSATEEEIT